MAVALERGSFRDPSGFVYTAGGTLYRQVNHTFAEEFDSCTASGLYDDLVGSGLLVPHEPAALALAATADAHAVIRPARIDFISYPYEWAFGELKDAALLTLEVMERALARGFVLRDASAYNVQFQDARPIFIDTLSFERYVDGRPWIAYKQFCEHFLVPLLLMAKRDVRCGQLLRVHLDGIPLDLGSRLLPRGTWAAPGALLHARAGRKYEQASVASVTGARTMSKRALLGLVAGLRSAVEGLSWQPEGTEWADYADDTNYSDSAAEAKRRLVRDYLAPLGARTAWDLGGNTGAFSRLARAVIASVVCFDFDPAAVELNYRQVRANDERGILPLLLDLMNPSPGAGWANEERMSLETRGPADVVMALALVHHLAIARNVPLPRIADALARFGRALVIEFVPKSDSQVGRLLRNRPDLFPDYTQEGFERAFAGPFETYARQRIEDSERWIYLLRRRNA
jgi:ribosomal protein L11 methylase PrmA